MLCKNCGREIPAGLLDGDGFRCPHCGRAYVRKGTQPTRKKTRPLTVLLVTALSVALCFAAVTLVARRFSRRVEAARVSATAAPTVSVEPTPVPTSDAEGAWASKYARTNGAVLAWAKDMFSRFTLNSDVRIRFDPNTPDVYELSTDVVLPAGTMSYVKSAMRFIEQESEKSAYGLDFSLVFLDENGSAVCVVLFGDSYKGYTVSGGGSTATYADISAIPDYIQSVYSNAENASI